MGKLGTAAKAAQQGLAKTAPLIRTVEFGLAFGCVLAAWFSTDMWLIIPALVVGWVFAVIGVFSSPNGTTFQKLAWTGVVAVMFIAIGLIIRHHLEMPAKMSRLEVSTMDLGFKPSQDRTFVNITLTNYGELAAIQAAHVSEFYISPEELSPQAADKAFRDMAVQLDKLRASSSSIAHTDPQTGFYFSADYPMTNAQLTQLQAAGRHVYIFAMLEYYDENSSPGEPRVNEICVEILESHALYQCTFHNGFRAKR